MSFYSRPLNSAPPLAFVFVNGILTMPGESEGWTDRAVTWVNTRTAAKAEKWEYATGPILRRLKQQERAEKIATMCGYYQRAGFAVVLGGHSNGCDIIARVLDLRGAEEWFFQKTIRSVHLFSGAADWSDFSRALARDDVGNVFLYCAGADRALQAAGVSRALLGWAGLGYGTLGLTGAVHVPAALTGRVIETREPTFGHSTWFEKGERFESTMQRILELETALLK